MPTIEELTKLRDIERKKYEEAQRLAEEALKNAMGSSPKIKDIEAAQSAFNTADNFAHQTYLKEKDINDAKTDAAEKKYQETCNKNNAELSGLTGDAYEKKRKENEEANNNARQEYLKTKAANDQASKEAYDAYLEIHEKNKNKMETAKENYSKHNPSTPSTAVQTKEPNEVISLYKNLFKDNDWYKDKQPTIENGKITLPFETDEDASNFAKKLAKENMKFTITDGATNKVLAFSNGDGKLYQIGKDGKPKEFTEPLRPSKEDMDKLPTLDAFQKDQKAQTAQKQTPTDAGPPLTSPTSSTPSLSKIPEVVTPKGEQVTEAAEDISKNIQKTGLNQ